MSAKASSKADFVLSALEKIDLLERCLLSRVWDILRIVYSEGMDKTGHAMSKAAWGSATRGSSNVICARTLEAKERQLDLRQLFVAPRRQADYTETVVKYRWNYSLSSRSIALHLLRRESLSGLTEKTLKASSGYELLGNTAHKHNTKALLKAYHAETNGESLYRHFESSRSIALQLLQRESLSGLTEKTLKASSGYELLGNTAHKHNTKALLKAYHAETNGENRWRCLESKRYVGIELLRSPPLRHSIDKTFIVSGSYELPGNTAAARAPKIKALSPAKPAEIHIHIGKLQDKIEIHTTTLQESLEDLEELLKKALLRAVRNVKQV